MSTSLKHRPFMALSADRTLVDVGQKQPSSAKVHELLRQVESEPEPVAEKKSGPKKGYKRSPEAIAKQKETLAKKRRSKARASNKVRGSVDKASFIRIHPDVPAPELVKMARKQGIEFTASHVYGVRKLDRRGTTRKAPKTQPLGDGPSSIDASLTDLLQTIITATSEIARRLSQLTL